MRVQILAACACLARSRWPRTHAPTTQPPCPVSMSTISRTPLAIGTAIDAAIEEDEFHQEAHRAQPSEETNAAHHRVTIGVTAQEISVAFDGNQPVRMPADGSTAKWTREDGEVFDVAARWTNDRLVQSFKAADGERINTFTLGSDGRALDVQVGGEESAVA